MYGKEITKHEEKNVTARFISESEYSGIIKKVRDNPQQYNGRKSGQKFDNILKQAEKRLTR